MPIAYSPAFIPLILGFALNALPSERMVQQRVLVPDAAAQEAAKRAAGEIFGTRFKQVQTAAEKTTLAAEMIDAAMKVEDGSPDQYALLKIATDIAAGAATRRRRCRRSRSSPNDSTCSDPSFGPRPCWQPPATPA